ncbi:type II secretion system protein N [Bermanella sp. R86510]|uniref:type II secretion system protein N n=1 Tax=unclassified Bermanella TaxID=2627862 RepID=UPI0037CAE13A
MADNWMEHKAVDPIITVLKWLLSLTLAYQLAVMTWLLVDQPTVVLPPPNLSGSGDVASVQKFDMAAWHLFGEADAEPIMQKTIDAPKTRLRLVLMGVFVGKSPTESSAIISEQGREGEFFMVGDRVQGRTRLSQVYEDKVILDNSGKLETLTFEESQKILKGISSQRTAVMGDAKPAENKKEFRQALRGIRTPGEFVEFAKEQLTDPDLAMKNLGVTSTGDGYVLTPSATMLMSIGMKPGDKLISINGHQLGDPARDREIIDQVYNSGQATIVIERGSRRLTIPHRF